MCNLTSVGIDGAYWGTTFPHLFLMTLPEHRPLKSTQMYQSRVYGFKVHASVLARPQQQQAIAAPTNSNTIASTTTATTTPATTQIKEQQQQQQQDNNDEDDEEKGKSSAKRKPKQK